MLFGFSFWPLRARDRLVAKRMLGALQQGFCWGLNLLRAWLVLPHFVSEFEKHNEELLGFCFVCV
jgi:hypothetical protein